MLLSVACGGRSNGGQIGMSFGFGEDSCEQPYSCTKSTVKKAVIYFEELILSLSYSYYLSAKIFASWGPSQKLFVSDYVKDTLPPHRLGKLSEFASNFKGRHWFIEKGFFLLHGLLPSCETDAFCYRLNLYLAQWQFIPWHAVRLCIKELLFKVIHLGLYMWLN